MSQHAFHCQYLPSYTIGPDAYSAIPATVGSAKVVVVGGKTALAKSQDALISSLKDTHVEVLGTFWYGGESTFENVDRLSAEGAVQQADALFAVGGGKCTDMVKVLGLRLGKPVYALPTIASNCSPVSKISIMYYPDGSFREIVQLPHQPAHTFINTKVCAEAPEKFLWAGLGDTPAKYYESSFSMRGDELSYEIELGKHVAPMCRSQVLKYGVQALADNRSKRPSYAFEQAALNVIVTTGIVSSLVGADYNSALAHALFYGLTTIAKVEQNHLHGEIVSYGVLVQLVMDGQLDELEKLKPFYHQMGLPTKLADLDLSLDDDFTEALASTESNQELIHTPYPVTKQRIWDAIVRLEGLQ